MLLNCGVLEDSLRVPWTARRSNQSILKDISPECSLEGLMLKLKLQCFGHLMRRTDSFEKTLMLGKTEGGRRRGRQKMRCLDGITTQWTWVWINSGSWWWTGRPGVLKSMGSQRVGQDRANEQQQPPLFPLPPLFICTNLPLSKKIRGRISHPAIHWTKNRRGFERPNVGCLERKKKNYKTGKYSCHEWPMNGLQATTDDLIAYNHVGSVLRASLSPHLCT